MSSRLVVFMMVCAPLFVSAQRKDNPMLWTQDINQRMVSVIWPTPQAHKNPGDPTSIVVLGFFINRDHVVTMGGLGDLQAIVDGDLAVIEKNDSVHKLALLKVAKPRSVTPLETTELPRDALITVYALPGRAIEIKKLFKPAFLLDTKFLNIAGEAGVGPGGGVFSQDGKLISIVFNGGSEIGWAQAIRPDIFRTFIGASKQ